MRLICLSRILSVLFGACATSVLLAAPLAFVANEKSATVSLIDTATDQRVGGIPAGERPRGITSGQGRVFVTDGKSASLLELDPQLGKIVRQINVGDSPEGVSLSPDGKLLAVAVEDDNAVVLIRVADGKVLARIKVQGKNPEHTVFSPDSRWLLTSAE